MSRFRMSDFRISRSTARRALAVTAVAASIATALPPAASAHDTGLSVKDAWVKTADSGMSAVFGTVANTSGKPVVVVSARTPASAMAQLHEVVMKNGSMVMQERRGGFRVPAKGRLILRPGGNHLMLMQLTRPIVAGQLIPVTLTLADGHTVTFKAVAKPFAGGNETYQPSASASPTMSKG